MRRVKIGWYSVMMDPLTGIFAAMTIGFMSALIGYAIVQIVAPEHVWLTIIAGLLVCAAAVWLLPSAKTATRRYNELLAEECDGQ